MRYLLPLMIGGLVVSPASLLAQQALAVERPRITGPLTLAQAVQTGLRDNLMVRAAQSDVRGAAADTRAARSMTRPQVSANSYLTYGDASNIVGSSPGVTPTNLVAVPRASF